MVAMQDQCAFNGAWGGGNRHPTAFYVSSYFWDRATDAGIIREPDAIMWDLKPADLVKTATLACNTPISGLAALFPKVPSSLDFDCTLYRLLRFLYTQAWLQCDPICKKVLQKLTQLLKGSSL